ncbi:MAG: hypothetical protein R2864_04150 [Syntrophotaleaceae bacterium]
MNLALSSLKNLLGRRLGARPGVRIEERRWRHTINALHRECEGLKRRMGGSPGSAQRR